MDPAEPTAGDTPDPADASTFVSVHATAGERFRSGRVFGAYRIERLLGRGGMGEVYAAEELESGRRVALKLLRRHLDPLDRARFLREGRLAASVSDPHIVYIFGTDEIEGIPTIAMEWAPGGTLKDRVRTSGPLAPAAAVDAILQVISGLEKAAAAGILHRDIKPSNCFIDTGGNVKVGDFGLSISTLSRGETELTQNGAMLGTPLFAAPEQLSGQALDVRSDIYAVGATLYYLLSGRAPIEDENLLRLIARVTQEVPPSPRTFQPAVPKALATVVLQCLAKQPAKRFASYSALVEALEPFGSAESVSGAHVRRLVAGTLDFLGIGLVTSLVLPTALATLASPDAIVTDKSGFHLGVALLQIAVAMMYFGLLEGIWGASVGKLACGLRVRATDGSRSLRRAWVRALLFTAIPGLAVVMYTRSMALMLVWAPQRFIFHVDPWSFFGLLTGGLLMFLSARPRSSYAGLHELLSGTRVFRASSVIRRTTARTGTRVEVSTNLRRLGPYVLLEDSKMAAPRDVLVGYDDRLRRPVWIHQRPQGSAPIGSIRRDLDRPSRTRWLAGSQIAEGGWDAYEAVPGKPFRSLSEPQSWTIVREWIRDIADELRIGLDDGTLSELSLDHVWIADDGRVRLLDWPNAGTSNTRDEMRDSLFFESGQRLLNQVARWALEGRDVAVDERSIPRPEVPLPLCASAFFRTLNQNGFESAAALATDAASLVQGEPVISRWTRLSHLSMNTIVVSLTAVSLMAWGASRRTAVPPGQAGRDLELVVFSLSELLTYDKWAGQSPSEAIVAQKEALETYLGGPLRKPTEDALKSTEPFARSLRRDDMQLRAQDILQKPPPSPAAVLKAKTQLQLFLHLRERYASASQRTRTRLSLMALAAAALMLVAGMISPFLFRGGLFLRSLDVVVVANDGIKPSRLRGLCRALIAWAPAFLFIVVAVERSGFRSIMANSVESAVFTTLMFHSMSWAEVLGLVVFAAGGVWAFWRPARGVQDWLSGTWLVPR